jgi:hypothetical protein
MKAGLPRPKFFNSATKKWKVMEEETVALRWEKDDQYFKKESSSTELAWGSAPTYAAL